MPGRAYRSKIEILRDVLVAAKHADKKTQIRGKANLNLTSFDRYLSYCLEQGLLSPLDGGFKSTPRAEQTLGAIETVLLRGKELHEALEELTRLTGPGAALLRDFSGFFEVPLRTRGSDVGRPSEDIASARVSLNSVTRKHR